MKHKESISISGYWTNAAFGELSEADLVAFAPATHRGSCIAAPGMSIAAGAKFAYDDTLFQVVKAWDEAADELKRAGSKNRKGILTKQEAAYYTSRAGKFIDLLVVRV